MDRVRRALLRRHAGLFVLDQRRLSTVEISLTVNEYVRGRLSVEGELVELERIGAMYIRPYDSRRLPDVASAGNLSGLWKHALFVDDALLSWAEITPARVVNRPSAMQANNSKPFQAELIRRSGLAVPETLITTDREAVLEFQARHGQLVYKSISGVRSIVSRLRLEQIARLNDVAYCPTQFQRFVPGLDHRVHVVGDRVFSCEVESSADDYRYPNSDGKLVIRACALPAEVESGVRQTVAAMGLDLAGVDLRRTPEGQWFCFEVNPSPAFTYFEDATAEPITEAVADLLITQPPAA